MEQPDDIRGVRRLGLTVRRLMVIGAIEEQRDGDALGATGRGIGWAALGGATATAGFFGVLVAGLHVQVLPALGQGGWQ
ncbi:hypothetical protein DBB33_06275 [Chromobacterium haemolyticum]|uniref:Uncharacterized protein n=1 Tax=Chromobacterium rhizoryzae TaxID=1778675 RepID=A0AAD0RSY1_9NEIS|nr:hypothetical protein D1345_15485 [Chromobacterium rhizoryzae]PTU69073.1 hypothetical protein DBB33_06275 [Chromobacterium haemolyticum]